MLCLWWKLYSTSNCVANIIKWMSESPWHSVAAGSFVPEELMTSGDTPQLAGCSNILILAHEVSGQGFANNIDIQECFNSHAAEEDLEELTALSNQM